MNKQRQSKNKKYGYFIEISNAENLKEPKDIPITKPFIKPKNLEFLKKISSGGFAVIN